MILYSKMAQVLLRCTLHLQRFQYDRNKLMYTSCRRKSVCNSDTSNDAFIINIFLQEKKLLVYVFRTLPPPRKLSIFVLMFSKCVKA